MLRYVLFSVLAMTPALLLGQPTNTVTVTASRNVDLPPDEGVFSLRITARAEQSVDDVVKVLAGTGVTAANLTNLQTVSGVQVSPAVNLPVTLQWTFQFTTPLAKLKESLTLVQQSIAQSRNGMSLSYSLGTSQASARQRQDCDYAGLIADARNKAQGIAGGAGFGTGNVVGVSGNSNPSATDCSLTVSFGLRGQSAQLGPNAMTITASRTLNPLPDQTLIGLTVNSSQSVGLDDVTGALAAAGVSGARFSGVIDESSFVRVGSSPVVSRPLTWSFWLVSPLNKLKDALAQLDLARQNLARWNPALGLTFSVQGVQTSPQAQPGCPQADLVADARTQAQKIAAAAGVTLGPILNMSDGPQGGGYATASFIVGSFSGLVLWPYTPPQSCSVSVQFQLQ